MILTIRTFNGIPPNTTRGDSTILSLKKHYISCQCIREEIQNLSLLWIVLINKIRNVIIISILDFKFIGYFVFFIKNYVIAILFRIDYTNRINKSLY